MPTYVYKCKKCGKEFEYMQRITEEPLEKCPKSVCEEEIKGEGEVFRKISKNIGLVFNGKGFYLTDYAHKHTDFNGNGKHKSNGDTAKSDGDIKTTETTTAPAKKETVESPA